MQLVDQLAAQIFRTVLIEVLLKQLLVSLIDGLIGHHAFIAGVQPHHFVIIVQCLVCQIHRAVKDRKMSLVFKDKILAVKQMILGKMQLQRFIRDSPQKFFAGILEFLRAP